MRIYGKSKEGVVAAVIHKKSRNEKKITPAMKRCEAESNRCTRFCRPLPNRSAIAPIYEIRIIPNGVQI